MAEMEIRTGHSGEGIIYPQQADGTMHVDNPDHVRTLRSYGAFLPAGKKARAAGWHCLDCGFLSWFRRCRCGSSNTEREGSMPTPTDEEFAQMASGLPDGADELSEVPTIPAPEPAGSLVAADESAAEEVVEEPAAEPEPPGDEEAPAAAEPEATPEDSAPEVPAPEVPAGSDG